MDIYRAQKEAERFAVDCHGTEKKIYFEIAILSMSDERRGSLKSLTCVWFDPSLGLFGIAGKEERGFTRISELDRLGAVEVIRQWVE